MKMDKGPQEVLRALREGMTEEEYREVVTFQRESFRARFGCYPEELEEVDPDSGEG